MFDGMRVAAWRWAGDKRGGELPGSRSNEHSNAASGRRVRYAQPAAFSNSRCANAPLGRGQQTFSGADNGELSAGVLAWDIKQSLGDNERTRLLPRYRPLSFLAHPLAVVCWALALSGTAWRGMDAQLRSSASRASLCLRKQLQCVAGKSGRGHFLTRTRCGLFGVVRLLTRLLSAWRCARA